MTGQEPDQTPSSGTPSSARPYSQAVVLRAGPWRGFGLALTTLACAAAALSFTLPWTNAVAATCPRLDRVATMSGQTLTGLDLLSSKPLFAAPLLAIAVALAVYHAIIWSLPHTSDLGRARRAKLTVVGFALVVAAMAAAGPIFAQVNLVGAQPGLLIYCLALALAGLGAPLGARDAQGTAAGPAGFDTQLETWVRVLWGLIAACGAAIILAYLTLPTINITPGLFTAFKNPPVAALAFTPIVAQQYAPYTTGCSALSHPGDITRYGWTLTLIAALMLYGGAWITFARRVTSGMAAAGSALTLALVPATIWSLAQILGAEVYAGYEMFGIFLYILRPGAILISQGPGLDIFFWSGVVAVFALAVAFFVTLARGTQARGFRPTATRP